MHPISLNGTYQYVTGVLLGLWRSHHQWDTIAVFRVKFILHGPSMFVVKVKIYGVLCKQSSSIAFDETSSHWSAPKNSLISRLFIDHHAVVWFPLVIIS